MIVGADLEWTKSAIDVLGLAWNEGFSSTAIDRNDQTLSQFLNVLKRADSVVMQNGLDADCRQLASEGIEVSWLEPKVYDVRLAMHVVNGHLAGTGSFDLRSMVLLLNGRQGQRFPLEWKQYASDLHRTCAMDSAAALWIHATLDRAVKTGKLQETLKIAHQVAPIFARMREQGVRLDKKVLEQIYNARKQKTEQIIERYHLWEERGKKVIKKVPIWRSDKILDICQEQFGFRPKDRQRKTWAKLAQQSMSAEAKEFIDAIIDLGKGANDAHWLGKAEETDSGELDFSKVGEDGFIHPRYDICGSPDRAIASGPNIQNFPRPDADPRVIKLRSAVVPLQADHVLLGTDFCVAPDTRILTSDLEWLSAETLHEGDELIGFDEDIVGCGGRGKNKRYFRRSLITGLTQLTQPCYRVTTDRGVVISSGLHKWLTKDIRKHGLKNYGWCQTDHLRPGCLIKFFKEPWEHQTSYDAGKMVGFLDGEGYVSSGGVYFGQNEGETLQEYLHLFEHLGFAPSLYNRSRHIGKHGAVTNQFVYCTTPGGRFEGLRLLGMLRPQRLFKKHARLWENRLTTSKRTEPAIVLMIEYLGEHPVIGIQTSTKTFIANGFFSHNSSVETITNAIESNDWDRVRATLDKRITHEGTAKIVNDTFSLSLTRQQGKAVNHGFDKGECVSPDTSILKADLTWVTAAKINIGDEVIGFDEAFHGKKSKYRRAVVENVGHVENPCYLVETDKGSMVASTNHAWLVRNFEGVYKWRTTDKLRVGKQLKFFGQPWATDESYIAGCLAGFFDGEGSVSRNGKTSAALNVAQNTGATLDHYRDLLLTLGYKIREQNKTHKSSKRVCTNITIRSRYDAMRFLGSIRPVRLLTRAYRFWENASVAGGQHEQPATIAHITFLGNRETVAIKTSTKTIITNGFLTHNSPYNLGRTLFGTERPSRQQVLQCEEIFKRMLSEYPKTSKFRDDLWERARDNPLTVTNSFGRRLLCFSRSKYGEASEGRFARHDPSKKYWCSCGECAPRRDRWKYAIAFLGRSAAFDALLRKMSVIWHEKRLDDYSLPYLEVHDELDFSVPRDSVEWYAQILKECFEEPIPELGGISLPASAVWGDNWANAH